MDGHGEAIFVQKRKTPTKKYRRDEERHRKSGQAEHSPGNRNSCVSARDHAVLLLGVDHGGVNCQTRSGVHYRARPAKTRRALEKI